MDLSRISLHCSFFKPLNCFCNCEEFQLTTTKYLWIFNLFHLLYGFFKKLFSPLFSNLVSNPTK